MAARERQKTPGVLVAHIEPAVHVGQRGALLQRRGGELQDGSACRGASKSRPAVRCPSVRRFHFLLLEHNQLLRLEGGARKRRFFAVIAFDSANKFDSALGRK